MKEADPVLIHSYEWQILQLNKKDPKGWLGVLKNLYSGTSK
jgi:hypothetical protein